MRFFRELPTSSGWRLVVEWISTSEGGARVTGKGGWARQAAAQASLSANGLPISVSDFYRLLASLLGRRSWTSLGVRM